MKYLFYSFLITLTILLATDTHAVTPTDIRFCGEPKRDVNGKILRSQTVLRNFQKIYACPSTGLHTGACPGWAKDHVISLDCGGCDTIFNLQWLPNDIKSSSAVHAKDRWERKIYYPNTDVPGTENCQFEIVK
jgi:hypothetical protein